MERDPSLRLSVCPERREWGDNAELASVDAYWATIMIARRGSPAAFPMKFVAFVALVALVALVSLVSMPEPKHNKGRSYG